jgi:Dyp-type peroxidase family
MNYSHLKRPDLIPFYEEMDKHINDVQGLIRRGYKSLPAAQFLMLQITDDIPGAKEYFNKLADLYITSGFRSETAERPNSFDGKKAVQIAFTSLGLKQLGLPDEILSTFSREFVEGMCHSYTDPDNPDHVIKERSILLGDMESNRSENWHWGNDKNSVHCVLMLYAQTNEDLDALRDACYNKLNKGVLLAYEANTYHYNPGDDVREHFGFKDGISQPIIRGFKKSDDESGDDQLVNPGEFILGHKNEYNSFSPSPWLNENAASISLDRHGCSPRKDLGKNGSYLVFRQMEQHVETFYYYLFHNSKEKGSHLIDKAVRLAAKMVGRWPEGQSLAVDQNEPSDIFDSKKLNDFRYNKIDAAGIGCPFGSHVRRTNPRDQVHAGRGPDLSLEMSKKHRILRRGRLYGQPLADNLEPEALLEAASKRSEERWMPDANQKTKIVRGIHFMCFVSDISRQFEFIQNVWANTSSFANLGNEVDPLISPRPTVDQPHCHEFTAPQDVVRNRYRKVPEFTTVVGGAYFFMPGIKALKFIMK